MRTKKHVSIIAVFAVSLLLGACHRQEEYKLTFVSQKDATQELRLTSKVGMVRPGGFPNNLLVRLFGQPDLTGTYELKTAEGTSKGTFIAGKDQEKQWIKFTPAGNAGKPDWSVKATSDGRFEGDSVVWEMKHADVKATVSLATVSSEK
jgi:hypothetical protein